MAPELHALLRRQLRRHFGVPDAPDGLRGFVEQVNEAYQQAEEERRMMERAFELSSQELMDTNAELAQASRAKDEFLAMLGHELRNPLAPIVTALDLAGVRGVSSIDVREIERPVRQVLRLVDDLLDIARVARGSLVLDKRPLDLWRAVRNAVEEVQPAVLQRRHTLEVKVPLGLLVDGDEVRLTQVVSNLLVNSVRYTEPGGHITVAGWRDGAEIVLSVRDDGRGIDPAALPQIFDSFGRSHPAGTQRGPGLGLGLTIVRGMIALHGGKVSAHSDGPGRGATFEVRLPLLPLAIPEQRSAPHVATAPVQRRKVLIVDDNQEAANLLADALTLSGHDVQLAYQADEALSRVDHFAPDVALLDVGLAEMSGHELGRRLRQRHAAVKLIALTGYGQPSDREASRRAGFAAHLVKPVSLSRILDVIDGCALG
ncbi:MAG TPA: hybrid sensor histidine kinase/response regulator [Polyangia bacterium]|jgi:signal transduction histidine kinase|nr:hybrid sensor histidine kinase/response regulator [Polyangia bacterium]